MGGCAERADGVGGRRSDARWLVAELRASTTSPGPRSRSRGGRFFFTRNSGLQNQGVPYVQDGIDGEPRVLLDPNRLSPDGTTALTALVPSEDGRLVAYAVSKGGSDLQVIHIRDVEASEDRRDRPDWAKFTTIQSGSPTAAASTTPGSPRLARWPRATRTTSVPSASTAWATRRPSTAWCSTCPTARRSSSTSRSRTAIAGS